MDILAILQLMGGVGLFLFGMSQMSSSLEKLTGSGLERILERVTTSKKKGVGVIKGWGFGAGVTAIIQSSAATTIMLVGFVNAGIMKVAQAMPVVFGSNVGSTVTAQILRLGDIEDSNLLLQLVKPESFAPMLVGTGAFMILFSKNKNVKNVAKIFVGLGMLFYGMTLMEEVFAPLKENAKFQSLLISFENPFVGMLIGVVITVILQSSSASVGILQGLSATGAISYAVAIPIIIGQNIGKCSTTIIGGIGANKKAKRIVVGYVFFNVFGALFISVILYILHSTVGLPFLGSYVNRGSIATIHLLFNLITSAILLPFSKQVSELTEKIIGGDEVHSQDIELSKLDDMLLNTPTIALEQCKSLIHKMAEAIMENYNLATSMIYEYDESKLPRMEENEAFIDKCETALSSYIVRIDRKRLTSDDKLTVNEILNSIGDFERIGDYCMNIAYVARDKNEKEIHFSPAGHMETEDIIKAAQYTLENCFNAFRADDISLAVRVEPLSEAIDELREIIKSHHVERLQEGTCSIEGGVSLFDLVNSFERIASHAANISLHVIKKARKDTEFDEMHGHANDNLSEEYKALYHYYKSKYIDPVLQFVPEPEAAITEKPGDADLVNKDDTISRPDDKEKSGRKSLKESKEAKNKKAEVKKAEDKRIEAKKSEAKKSEAKKTEEKKTEEKKTEVKKSEVKNSDAKKNSVKKSDKKNKKETD